VSILDGILNIIFPRTCVGCGRVGRYVCSHCVEIGGRLVRLETICPVCTKPAVNGATHPRCQTRYSPDGLVSVFRYEGIVRNSIKLIKYRRVSDIASELSTLTVDIVQRNNDFFVSLHSFLSQKPIITAIPLSQARERYRWFNQSALLAQGFASKWNIEFSRELLVRTKFNKPQAGLLKEDRMENIKGAFSSSMHKNAPHSIVLFDDVWTTGATMREATNVLKRGGVKKVWCLTLAR
jgi:competence protein ComFC